MKSNKHPSLERLLRGISTDHAETVRGAWRDLLKLGDAVVPDILGKLDTKVWAEKPRGPAHKYLGLLLALLDELNPALFQQEIARLLSSRLHPLHRKTVEIMSNRRNDQPATRVGPDIPVYISREINNPQPVLRNLHCWVQTHDLDLLGVTRIDVITRHPQLDYLGLYNLFFSGIVLTWPNIPARGLRMWWQRINAEFTFYHEVGHHACGHLEGGQVADQEKEADIYARKMLRHAHPVLMTAARTIIFPFRPLLRKYAHKKR